MQAAQNINNCDFKDKIALVTGASSGIGLQTAEQLSKRGAHVIRVDKSASTSPPWQYATDISNTKEIDALLGNIESSHGSIDLLVHAAGILKAGPLLDYSSADWLTTFSVNTFGAFYLCQQVGQRMAARQTGAMVVVGSNCASTPRLQIGAYAASKAATQQMLKCLGLELAAYGVRCNIVAPGSTDTPMQRSLCLSPSAVDKVVEGSAKDYRLGIPLKKMATADDIANAICFLLSEQASHITLETLTVDGGATLGQ